MDWQVIDQLIGVGDIKDPELHPPGTTIKYRGYGVFTFVLPPRDAFPAHIIVELKRWLGDKFDSDIIGDDKYELGSMAIDHRELAYTLSFEFKKCPRHEG